MRIHFIQHVAFESPGFLLEWAEQHAHTISFSRMYEQVNFPAVQDVDLLIIMGGPMGVYEENKYHWLKPEKEFIRKVIDNGKKVLGICLGAQLLAEVLGSKVYPNVEKEIGWWPVQTIRHEKADLLTGDLPEIFTAFHWHGDTFDLPKGAVHLFRTDICHNQGFIFNEQVAGLQFHLEATAPLIDQMLHHGRSELVIARYIEPETEIRDTAHQYLGNTNRYLNSFVNNFLKL